MPYKRRELYHFLAFGICPASKLRIADALKKRAVWECDVRRSDKAPLATTTPTMDAKNAARGTRYLGAEEAETDHSLLV